jgi:hypothetical protein
VNRKARRRKYMRRKYTGPIAPTAVTMALGRVHAQADREKVQATQQYIDKNMTLAGFLPDGNGSWRAMTPVERTRWLGKED